MLEGVNPRLIFAILFTAGVIAALWFDRNKIERHSILFIRRTQRGIDLLDRIAKKAPRFWNAYGWMGVFFAILSIPLMLIQIVWIMNNVLTGGPSEEGAAAVLPSLSAEPTLQPGAFFIPIEYWVISIGIIMVVHEASHGIIARLEGFEINSVGWLVLGIIPGAFVEPKGMQLGEGDEDGEGLGAAEIWDQGTYKQRLKVLAAGSWANYVTAAFFGLIWVALVFSVLPAYADSSVTYQVAEDSPAAAAGMMGGTVHSINGEAISNQGEFLEIMSDTSPGDTVTLNTSEGEFEVELGSHPDRDTGLIGIDNISTSYGPGIDWLVGLIGIIVFLNFAIGIFNLMPAKPLDGGHIVDTFVEEFGKEEQRKYVNYFSVFLWVIVIGSLIAAVIL